MKVVSLIYGYSARNAGDFAITLGALDLLLELGFSVKLFSRYDQESKDYKDSTELLRKRYGERIAVYGSPFCLDRSDSSVKTLMNYADGALSLLGIKRNSDFKANLLDCDYVVFNGGNLFRCESFLDFARLCALMFPLKIAKAKDKPYAIFPQSASRLRGIGQKLLLPLIENAKLAFFREKESYAYINQFIDDKNFKQTIDLAFFINKQDLSKLPTREKPVIAITLRFHTVGDIAYLPQDDIEHIFNTLEPIVTEFKLQYHFVIVVQTDKDEDLSRKFADKHHLELWKSNDPIELISFYKDIDLLIGMRLHSIILALSVGTPCLGIFYKQWGLKNPGLMQYFDMPYVLLDDGSANNDVPDMVKALLENRAAHSDMILKVVGDEYQSIKLELESRLL